MKKILSLRISFFLSFLLFIIDITIAQPINLNGGFEEAAPGPKIGNEIPGWTIYVLGAAAAEFEIVEDEVMEGSRALWLVSTNVDANAWDIQVVNEPFTVQPNTRYKYSIWIKADFTGTVINFTVGNPSYNEWGRAHQVAIGTDWQEVTFEFTTPADASAGRAPIHLGETANLSFLPVGYYLDDLRITDVTTGVDDKNRIPTSFSLDQNYPNPFNPTTNIEFNLPERSNVHLSLVNILGEVVKVLAEGNYSEGNHKKTMNASNLATGVYFYRLEAGDFVSVKKLILMK